MVSVSTRAGNPPRRSAPPLEPTDASHSIPSGTDEVFPPAAFSPEGVDLTLVDAWLDMSPEQRLDALQEMLDFVALARRGRPSEAP